MRTWLAREGPVQRSLAGTAVLSIPLLAVAVLVGLVLGPAEQQVALTFFIVLIAVVGFGMYSGNSGIMTFGHVAFMGIAAYASGILTMPAAIKAQALPNLLPALRTVELPLGLATIGALLVVLGVALLFGYPFSRLSAAATPIATLAMLMITYVILVGAADVTRGSQTFYGVPPLVDLRVVVPVALAAILFARMFRESVPGLRLRASREDELAARSMGVAVPRLRLFAWLLSALVVGIAGVMLGHTLTAFSPKQFYFTLQFALVAMLVVGGPTTVTGAVGGAALVSLLMETARRVEGSLTAIAIGPIQIEQVFGLQEITLGLVILAVMYRRRDGLLGRAEADEWLRAWWRRRRGSTTPGEGSDDQTARPGTRTPTTGGTA
jgi:branched-chain amino acid transport system permease protein